MQWPPAVALMRLRIDLSGEGMQKGRQAPKTPNIAQSIHRPRVPSAEGTYVRHRPHWHSHGSDRVTTMGRRALSTAVAMEHHGRKGKP